MRAAQVVGSLDYAIDRVFCEGAWTLGLVLCTAAGAQVAVPLPFTPVPLTLQVFSVLLAGLLLRPGAALACQALYVGLGLLGVPWFATLSALPLRMAMLSATFGYLLGFLAAAPLVAVLRERVGEGRAVLAGLVSIYFCGAVHLAVVLDLDFSGALMLGVLPFVPLDLIKAVLAVRVAAFLRRPRTAWQ